MKTYVILALSIAALAAGSGAVSAQSDTAAEADRPAGGHHGRHGHQRRSADPMRMVKRMTRRLDLDETQQQTISNIVEAAKPEFEVLRDRSRANRQAMRQLVTTDPDYSAKLSNLAAETGEVAAERTRLFGRVRSEINAELTDEQRAELESLASERSGRFGRRGNRE